MSLKVSQNSQENTIARVSFLIKLQAEAWNFIEKETMELYKKGILAEVFYSEFCKIFKNTFFKEHLRVTASPFNGRSVNLPKQ